MKIATDFRGGYPLSLEFLRLHRLLGDTRTLYQTQAQNKKNLCPAVRRRFSLFRNSMLLGYWNLAPCSPVVTMKKALSLLAALLLLSACVHDKAAYLPDGSTGYHISCNGSWFSMGDCINRAGELCKDKGYTVINQNGEALPFAMSNGGFSSNAYGASGGYNSQSGVVVNRDLFVKCN